MALQWLKGAAKCWAIDHIHRPCRFGVFLESSLIFAQKYVHFSKQNSYKQHHTIDNLQKPVT